MWAVCGRFITPRGAEKPRWHTEAHRSARARTHAHTHTYTHSLSLSLSLSLSHAQVILPYNDEPSWLWRQFRDTVLELSWEV